MKIKLLVVILFASVTLCAKSFKTETPVNYFQNYFDQAYIEYPLIPKGILEAVSYSMTRFQHIQPNQESCTGLPLVYGVMGLTLDGKNYFNNNLNYISQVSGVSVEEIINSPKQNILAYASAYQFQLSLLNPSSNQEQNVAHILTQLSELPLNSLQQDFALNSHLYSVLSFMNNPEMQQAYNFPNPNYDLEKVFGAVNLNILKSKSVTIKKSHIEGDKREVYQKNNSLKKSIDYPPALENFTSCNFSSRGVPVSAVTVHTIQGSYAGAISWANNCSSNVSYHYVLRSSDGQVTQVVLESNKAWHVGSENPYTIGLEHEGYVSDSTWYTAAMYQSSADLVRDITQSGYGINPLRTAYFPWASRTHYKISGIPGNCVTIKAHQHYPNQVHEDPGEFWDWDYYYKLLNEPFTPVSINTNISGNITDLGGDTSNYTNDERTLFLIQPTNAESITLTVNAFDVEANWDYLYIYNGTTPFDEKIGEYTGTTIPSSITVNSGNVLIEFRSDCATTNPGYDISWSSIISDTIKPTSVIGNIADPVSDDFTVDFTDEDNAGGSGVNHVFYQVADTDGTEWRANDGNGYYNDEFNASVHSDWIDSSGVWSITGGYLAQTDEANGNTNLYADCNQNDASKYLYHFKTRINGAGGNRRAGFHYMCDDASQTERGNSYFIWYRLDDAKLQFYKVVNNVFSLEKAVDLNFNANEWYDVKIVYDKTTGKTEVWWNDEFIADWIDVNSITTGNQISLRSGNCILGTDELMVYKTRTSSEQVTVGQASTDDIRYQGMPSGRINTIVIDSALNVSETVTKYVNVDWTVGINEFSAIKIEVYPNPFSDMLKVKSKHMLNSIKLTDALGKVYYQKDNSSNEVFINTQELPSGIYFLEVNEGIVKLIKY